MALSVLPSGIDVVCGVVAVREDDGPDWLDFYLPIGVLSRADSRFGRVAVGFGPDDAVTSLSWRQPIDEWFAGIGRRVYDEVDYRLALIANEASGVVYARPNSRRATRCLAIGPTSFLKVIRFATCRQGASSATSSGSDRPPMYSGSRSVCEAPASDVWPARSGLEDHAGVTSDATGGRAGFCGRVDALAHPSCREGGVSGHPPLRRGARLLGIRRLAPRCHGCRPDNGQQSRNGDLDRDLFPLRRRCAPGPHRPTARLC